MQNFVQQHGYLALFILSILESMCIPIPSEATFGFAGFMTSAVFAAHHAHGHHLSIVTVIVIGGIGSLVGSAIAYEVGRTAGRSIIDRWGKWILITHADLDKAEAWFEKYGWWSVLIGRVIPVVRTVISVPAGLAKMHRAAFATLTTLGATAWVALLALIGRAAGDRWTHYSHYFKVAQYPIVAIIIVVGGLGLFRRIKTVRAHHAAHGSGR